MLKTGKECRKLNTVSVSVLVLAYVRGDGQHTGHIKAKTGSTALQRYSSLNYFSK